MMENSEKNQLPTDGKELLIDSRTRKNLDETRKWTMFFAILGFIGIGFLVIGALILLVVGIFANGYLNNSESALFGVLTVLYLIMGGLYFLPILYLLKFSSNMKLAIEKLEQSKLVAAFDYLKSHFKFIGILTIIFFCLYILLGVAFAVGGIFSIL